MKARLSGWFQRRIVGGLSLIGIGGRGAINMAADLVAHKTRLAVALGTSIVAPVAELGFIALLYAVVDAAQREQLLRVIDAAGVTEMAQRVGIARPEPLFAVAALGLLAIAIAAKYASGYLHSQFLFFGFITQARRIVEAYLFATPERAAGVDRGRVANAAIGEALQHGKIMFALLDALANAAAAVVFLVAAFMASARLMAVAAALALLTLLVTRRGYATQKRIGARRVEVQSALVGGLWEILNSYRTVKVEAGERRLLHRFADDLRIKQVYRLDNRRNELYMKLGSETVLYVSLLTIVVVATQVLRSDASLILVFLVLMGRLQKYLGQLQQTWIDVQHGLPSITMMTELLDTCAPGTMVPPPMADAPSSRTPFRIRFEDVTFEYGEEARIFEGLHLEIEPGERILIQGASGQGKSTLLYLACGLLRPSAGRVLINGEPLTDEVFYRMRPSMTYVAPNSYLFRGSIRQNLCLGYDYPDDRIRAALEQARLGGLVDRLPGGIDGDIGENGGNLSLGERQRVMLARIFLKNPLLILMDEATANLDLENERTILAELLEHVDARATLIIVTHRAPADVPFTRTLELSGGRFVDRRAGLASAAAH